MFSEAFNGQAERPQTGEEPTFKTQVRIVLLDVVVTDREGRPVQDLPKDSFRVEEDGDAESFTGDIDSKFRVCSGK